MALLVFYLGFSAAAKRRLMQIWADLKSKNKTQVGKERQKRIICTIFYQTRQTSLILNAYEAILPLLQKYTKLFQKSGTLCHLLHTKQVQVFTNFLSCCIKPEELYNKKTSQLVSLDISNNMLPISKIYFGNLNKQIILDHNECSIVERFKINLHTAYESTCKYLQKKLPLDSLTLKALASLDPDVRGDQLAAKLLNALCEKLKRFIPENIDIDLEVREYQVDNALNSVSSTIDKHDNNGVCKYWGSEHIQSHYPGLHSVAFAALSVFHGPAIESSFSVMGNVMDKGKGRMNVSTYSSYQVIKYHLRNEGKSATQMFSSSSENIDLQLCTNVWQAAGRYKKKKTDAANREEQRRILFGVSHAAGPASKETRNSKEIREKELRKQQKKSRKRACEVLSAQRETASKKRA